MSIISIKNIGVPIIDQIINSVELSVVNKILKKGDKLPSVNSIRNKYSISRDTVFSAYKKLKMRGIIQSVPGKGYYLISENITTSKKIFLLFDELNAFKENLYNSFISKLEPNIDVDVFFHHFNYDVFRNAVINNNGNYSYYVIMPGNLNNIGPIINFLPDKKVYILDQIHDDLKKYPAIYQNFEKGIIDCLNELRSKILNYSKMILVFDKLKQPESIKKGFKSFCYNNKIQFEILSSIEHRSIKKGNIYMLLEDSSLISVIKKARIKNMKVSKDIGIISYNATPLKEIIENGITVISTDFNEMGTKLAEMITNRLKVKIENNISLTLRNSV